MGLFSLMPLNSSSLLRAMKGGAPNIMLYRRMPKAHLYRRMYRRMPKAHLYKEVVQEDGQRPPAPRMEKATCEKSCTIV